MGLADPAAEHVLTVGVDAEEHGAHRADAGVCGGVPAHEDGVVPEAEFAAPEVAAFVEGDVAAVLGVDLDQVAALAERDGLGREYVRRAVPPEIAKAP